MDSPGNDLESIAGQVASGSNLILFITGNGSITKLPVRPDPEVRDHDRAVRAARERDGRERGPLQRRGWTWTRSGRRPSSSRSTSPRDSGARERLAGHAQVSLWRDWPRTSTAGLRELGERPAPDGRPIPRAEGAGARRLLRRGPHRVGDCHRPACPGDADQPLLGTGGAAHRRGPRHEPASVGATSRASSPSSTPRGAGRTTRPSSTSGPCSATSCTARCAHAVLLEHGCEQTPQRRGPPLPRRAGLLRRPLRWGQRADGRRDREGAGEGRGGSSRRWRGRRGVRRGGPDPEPEPERTMPRAAPPGAFGRRSGAGGASYRPRRERPRCRTRWARSSAGSRPASSRPGRPWSCPATRAFSGAGAFREAAFPAGAGAPAASLAFGQPADQSGFHVMEAPTENPVETFTGARGDRGRDHALPRRTHLASGPSHDPRRPGDRRRVGREALRRGPGPGAGARSERRESR